MSAAFTRRAALRGSVAAALGLAAVVAPVLATPALSANDRRLVELADALHALERRCNEHSAKHAGLEYPAAEAAEDEFGVLTSGYSPLEEEMAATPSDTLAGVLAKLRALEIPTCDDCESGISRSVCDDVRRLVGGAHG